MRVGVLDLASGLSGDMLLAAALDAGAPRDAVAAAVAAATDGRATLEVTETIRAGLRALRAEIRIDGVPVREPAVHEPHAPHEHPHDHGHEHGHGHTHAPDHDHDHEHAHTPFTEVQARIARASLDPVVRERSGAVYQRLAEAESRVHGVPVDQVHFHEVGALDAVADIVGSVAALHALGLERILHGPIAVGGGTVSTDHGVLPVPAPATLALLEGRSLVVEPGAGELLTPTGAALLVTLTEPAPSGFAYRPDRTGYGAGHRNPGGRPNVARLILGDVEGGVPTGRVAVIEASLDDCTPEEGGHLLESLMADGARDVTLTPIIMKKGRPGFLLRVIADPDAGPEFAARVVARSPSLGARWRVEDRVELPRRTEQVVLPGGTVRIKVATLPDGSERAHPEYEDLAALARTRGQSLGRIRSEVEQVWNAGR